MMDLQSADISEADPRVRRLFQERYHALTVRCDRLLLKLMLAQWAAAVVFAYWVSPLAWAGRHAVIHGHVYAALFIGGAITSLPLYMVLRHPGEQSTRYVTSAAQVLWSALIIHLTGGRIESHFHVFGSLAILSFYRDLKVLVPATVIVAADHFIRGLHWPESVYGVTNPEWWRFLEHAGWVVFIDAFLVYNCVQSRRELWLHCEQQVALQDATDANARMERLAAIGQLAASVGHELRNPLAAIRNAYSFIRKRLAGEGSLDPRVLQFLEVIGREVDASGRIIGNLLDFSRPKQAVRGPCPLRPLVEEALQLVPARANVRVVDEVPDELPVLDLDKDQLRQVLVNLVQNASEAIPAERQGTVVVTAEIGPQGTLRLDVRDDGCGIPTEEIGRVFQPLFSTKTRGTGLGLAVASGVIERHGGRLTVQSRVGEGTTFNIELPLGARTDAA
jgi:two-component system, NtrC family, sensor histidine kinase HydH